MSFEVFKGIFSWISCGGLERRGFCFLERDVFSLIIVGWSWCSVNIGLGSFVVVDCSSNCDCSSVSFCFGVILGFSFSMISLFSLSFVYSGGLIMISSLSVINVGWSWLLLLLILFWIISFWFLNGSSVSVISSSFFISIISSFLLSVVSSFISGGVSIKSSCLILFSSISFGFSSFSI